MGFPLNKSLSTEQIDERRQFLINNIGLSGGCIKSLERHTPSLCASDKVVIRIDKLKELGFDVDTLIQSNPTLLNRSRETVQRRFYMVQKWFCMFDRCSDVHKLMHDRVSLWSCGHHKLFINFLLASHIKKDVTPERICNVITINLENLLMAFMSNPQCDYMQLRCGAAALGRKVPILSKQQKQQVIIQSHLPDDVLKYYKKHCIK